jgi:hypothetical protein
MAIFNSYVILPEGTKWDDYTSHRVDTKI